MKEIFKQKEIPASESEIKQAVEGWWDYLERKMQVHPHLARGIVPRLVFDEGLHSEATRTVQFSLVDTMAPELSDFGKLVNAKIPHVYVEGTRTPDVAVRLEELYFDDTNKQVFSTDRNNLLRYYLFGFEAFVGIHDLQIPKKFLLYIYTADDIGKHGRVYENVTVEKLVFFSREDDTMGAFDLSGGWREFHFNPRLNMYANKHVDIKPATQSQIRIIQDSFENARLKLE